MKLYQSAKALGLSCCPCCQKLNKLTDEKQQCSRCGQLYGARKAKSLQYTLAWTMASIVMFIPANIYPMMIFYKLGKSESSTILEGIATFIKLGLYPIAFIIFIASFIIPLGKICCLFLLMYNTTHQSFLPLTIQTKLYQLVELLGPWSMLDVFVVTVMVAIVNLGFITTIEAASGITYFTLMVIFTMFAAESFDPRLLWDNSKSEVGHV